MALEVRPVIWLGNSRKNMQEFPKKVRSNMGAALFAAQCGEIATHVKPFKGVGCGVFEIAERYSKDTYRHNLCSSDRGWVVRAARLPEEIEIRQCNPENGRGLD